MPEDPGEPWRVPGGEQSLEKLLNRVDGDE